MAPDLPGYYFDQAKGKYFKIVPNQHATANTSYSKAAVAAKEVRHGKESELDEWREKSRKTIAKLDHLLNVHPHGGMLTLRREFGHHQGHTDSATAKIWAKGLSIHAFIHRPVHPVPGVPRYISNFIRDPGTGAIAWAEGWWDHAFHSNCHPVRVPTEENDEELNTVGRWYMSDTEPLGLEPDSETSSLTISPNRVVLATGLGRHNSPSLHMIRLIEPSAYSTIVNNALNWQRERDLDRSMPQDAYLPGIGIEPGSRVPLAEKVNTVWCSAAGPHTDSAMFAVGTSRGTQLVGSRGDAVTELRRESNWPDDETSLDTLAVDFQTHTNVLCGMRSGKVRLWDCRANDSNVKFQHGSCVTHLRAISEEKVLVAGLEDQLSLYDLRFIKTLASLSPEKNRKRGAPILTPFPPSSPLVNFPAYRMQATTYPRLGFDVYRNLVACGTEDQTVQLFDLHTGKELRVGCRDLDGASATSTIMENRKCSRGEDVSKPLNAVLKGPARCLKFVEYEHNGAGLRLLVANGMRIDAWAW